MMGRKLSMPSDTLTTSDTSYGLLKTTGWRQRFYLIFDGITLGNDRSSDIFVDGEEAERWHAIIRLDDDGPFLHTCGDYTVRSGPFPSRYLRLSRGVKFMVGWTAFECVEISHVLPLDSPHESPTRSTNRISCPRCRHD